MAGTEHAGQGRKKSDNPCPVLADPLDNHRLRATVEVHFGVGDLIGDPLVGVAAPANRALQHLTTRRSDRLCQCLGNRSEPLLHRVHTLLPDEYQGCRIEWRLQVADQTLHFVGPAEAPYVPGDHHAHSGEHRRGLGRIDQWGEVQLAVDPVTLLGKFLEGERPVFIAESLIDSLPQGLSNQGLVASNLGKRFKKRPVVRGVTLSIQRGEIVGLLGPNGAGKTTCFYIITGLLAPDYGNVILDGHDITDLPMYRRARLGIGYLPQEASIFRGLTVEGNIRSVIEVTETSRENREGVLEALLAEFSISHLRRTPALSLSGGERRRVEIARSLASGPHFGLLDEPFAGIDPIAVGDLRDLVMHLKDRGIGVLITDHNVRETLDIIDRAYIIHDGMVLMEGSPSDIVGNEDVRRVYLGDQFRL